MGDNQFTKNIKDRINRLVKLWFVAVLLIVPCSAFARQTPAAATSASPAPVSPQSEATIIREQNAVEPAENASPTDAARATKPPRPAFKPLRYEEDWSSLGDESNRADYADRLKYISLGKEGWFLSLGGTVRPFYEYFKNENWGAEPQDKNGWLLQRYMMHADFHFGRRARVFGELKSALINNRRGGARVPDKDRLDVHQLFFDYNFSAGKNKSLTLRVGRQEFSFGSGRLLTFREGPNARQSFDAVRASSKIEKWSVDGFVSKPVETDAGIFDDEPVWNQTFWGAYAVRPLHRLLPKKGNIDVYYFGIDRKRARFNQGAGREIRQTVGTRLWNAAGNALDYNFELVYQFGKFGRGRISAWTAASDTGYTFKNIKFSPRFGLKANVTSGDRDPLHPDLQTFNALFPKGAYFGQLSPIGPSNHTDLHPGVNLKLLKNVELSGDWLWFWRTSTSDGVYGMPGNLVRSGNSSRARFIGQNFSSELRWQIDRHTSLNLSYARFFAGDFLRETPPSKNTSYFAAWVNYKF